MCITPGMNLKLKEKGKEIQEIEIRDIELVRETQRMQ
jgi:hypothetical protein